MILIQRYGIKKNQGALTMNCIDGEMKFNHLTKYPFQSTVSLKRVVKLS